MSNAPASLRGYVVSILRIQCLRKSFPLRMVPFIHELRRYDSMLDTRSFLTVKTLVALERLREQILHIDIVDGEIESLPSLVIERMAVNNGYLGHSCLAVGFLLLVGPEGGPSRGTGRIAFAIVPE